MSNLCSSGGSNRREMLEQKICVLKKLGKVLITAFKSVNFKHFQLSRITMVKSTQIARLDGEANL